MIASIKMILWTIQVQRSLSEAVYVTTDTVDPANDGKAIVSAPLSPLKSGRTDDEMAYLRQCLYFTQEREDEYERNKMMRMAFGRKSYVESRGLLEEYREGMVKDTQPGGFYPYTEWIKIWKDYDEQVLKN